MIIAGASPVPGVAARLEMRTTAWASGKTDGRESAARSGVV